MKVNVKVFGAARKSDIHGFVSYRSKPTITGLDGEIKNFPMARKEYLGVPGESGTWVSPSPHWVKEVDTFRELEGMGEFMLDFGGGYTYRIQAKEDGKFRLVSGPVEKGTALFVGEVHFDHEGFVTQMKNLLS